MLAHTMPDPYSPLLRLDLLGLGLVRYLNSLSGLTSSQAVRACGRTMFIEERQLLSGGNAALFACL
jgi:hypothetical protein